MKVEFITCEQQRRLILVFAGWAMDRRPFETLHRKGYDVALAWDYRSFDFDCSIVEPYDEVVVIAWSFGVAASAIVMPLFHDKITCRIAVNGTLYPVDDYKGIPKKIFMGTLENMNARNLAKFYRRMAGTAEEYNEFARTLPQRNIDELIEELKVFRDITLNDGISFDMAIVGKNDAIIPSDNQLKAWGGINTFVLNYPHMISLQEIIDRYVIDKDSVGQSFESAAESYDAYADIQRDMAMNLFEMAKGCGAFHLLPGDKVLEVGSGSGFFSRLLDKQCGGDNDLILWDMAMPSPVEGRDYEKCDGELRIQQLTDNSLAVVACAATVQWFNSPERFIKECARVLRPGGFLLLSTFYKGNLAQIEELTGISLPQIDAESWKAMAAKYLELKDWQVVKSIRIFDTPLDVFRHLKFTGVNAVGSSDNSPAILRKALKEYPKNRDHRYELTYHPLYLILQKK